MKKVSHLQKHSFSLFTLLLSWTFYIARSAFPNKQGGDFTALMAERNAQRRSPDRHLNEHKRLKKGISISLDQPVGRERSSLSNQRRHAKTILLMDGEASETTSYQLVLKGKDRLREIFHVTNDTTILTGHSHHVQELRQGPPAAYNITLNHEFSMNVGPVSYVVRLRTLNHRYILSGTFYVAGIVVKATRNGSEEKVSGMASGGLHFESPTNVSLNSSIGQLPLSVEYQSPGADISQKPVPLKEVLSTATLSLQFSEWGSDVRLMNYEPNTCQGVQPVVRNSAGFFMFSDTSCGVGFDYANQLLVLNMNRETWGTIVLTITSPTIRVKEEVFETTLKIYVARPQTPLPVVAAPPERRILLDFYGSELFGLSMYNTIVPSQEENATLYIVELPYDRYAQVDFKHSVIARPIQHIVFRSVPPGRENPKLLKLLMRGRLETPIPSLPFTDDPTELGTTLPSPDSDGFGKVENLVRPLFGYEDFERNSSRDMENNINSAANTSDLQMGLETVEVANWRVQADVDTPESESMAPEIFDGGSTLPLKSFRLRVFLIIPPREYVVVAIDSDDIGIQTAFAPPDLAKIGVADWDFAEKVVITITLDGYSTQNFSDHKSRQIRESIASRAQSRYLQSGITGEVALVNLKNSDSFLEATYGLEVSGNASEIARVMNMNKELAEGIASDARLDQNKIKSLVARSSFSKDVPGNLGNGHLATSLPAPLGGALVAAVVILSGIVAIPFLAVCYGILVTRRNQVGSHGSDPDTDDSLSAIRNSSIPNFSPVNASSPEVESSETFVEEDTHGRAEQKGNLKSFKMQKELFQRGYFGDNLDNSSADAQRSEGSG